MTPSVAMLGGIALVCILAACAPEPESGRGFRLPDGDPIAGQDVFLTLQCHACHTIADLELPPFFGTSPISLELGGEVAKVKTYGELVTSIINPSHKLVSRLPKEQVSLDGKSLMPTVNDVMTVQQLVDLVSFLQAHYEVLPPEHYPYGTFGY